jgi:predicted nucleotidyltransferase
MRLTEAERQAIREVVGELTGGRARAIVFGSRLDESARGGDIDLLVESSEPVDQPARLAALIGARLESELGEQRIDGLIGAPTLTRLPVHESARLHGATL